MAIIIDQLYNIHNIYVCVGCVCSVDTPSLLYYIIYFIVIL